MKLSYKFIIWTLLVVCVFALANVLALKYYASENFKTYLESIKQQTTDLDDAFIRSVLDNKQLDPKLIEEYRDITQDLAKISSSLEDFSKNPRPLNDSGLLESMQKSGIPASTIEKVIGTNALQSFFSNILNFVELDASTPEGIFILSTLRSMAYFNLIILAIILILTFIWVTYAFRPVSSIIENLSNIIHKKEYKNILYKRKDEFHPLIEAINNLNKSLSIQEKIRSDFLSDLSHEIKTPITAIKCYIEGIEDGMIKLDEKNLKMLYDEIERLIKITNSIMEYEKEEQKRIGDVFIDDFDLCDLTEKTIDEYAPIFAKNSQQCVSFIPKGYSIKADKDKFKQIFHNVFSNYAKYSGKDTTLTVKAMNKPNAHLITFKDDGLGVAENELPFITEKFYKVDKVRQKAKDSGVGIGLSIIERIVKLHDGEMEIRSQTGKGFEIILKMPK